MISGVCRICKCTENKPCLFSVDGETFPCSWMDEAQTLCSSLRCVAVVPLDEIIDIVFPRKAAAATAR